jgi:hypothetical protein
MSNSHTPAEAAERLRCPLAATFGGDLQAKCRGDGCAAWRWLPVMANDPRFESAIKREIACLQKEASDAGKKEPSANLLHQKAVAKINKNPAGYGITSTHGYCGVGGPPT